MRVCRDSAVTMCLVGGYIIIAAGIWFTVIGGGAHRGYTYHYIPAHVQALYYFQTRLPV